MERASRGKPRQAEVGADREPTMASRTGGSEWVLAGLHHFRLAPSGKSGRQLPTCFDTMFRTAFDLGGPSSATAPCFTTPTGGV
jgi:hypothetical protein